jgi:hypothetical protein
VLERILVVTATCDMQWLWWQRRWQHIVRTTPLSLFVVIVNANITSLHRKKKTRGGALLLHSSTFVVFKSDNKSNNDNDDNNDDGDDGIIGATGVGRNAGTTK